MESEKRRGEEDKMMFQLFGRIIRLSGKFKWRIQCAFICAVIESILAKMPIVFAFFVLDKFSKNTLEGKDCICGTGADRNYCITGYCTFLK